MIPLKLLAWQEHTEPKISSITEIIMIGAETNETETKNTNQWG